VPVQPVAEFAMVSKALKWVKDDVGPHGFRAWDRLERIGLLAGPGEPALIAPHRSLGCSVPGGTRIRAEPCGLRRPLIHEGPGRTILPGPSCMPVNSTR